MGYSLPTHAHTTSTHHTAETLIRGPQGRGSDTAPHTPHQHSQQRTHTRTTLTLHTEERSDEAVSTTPHYQHTTGIHRAMDREAKPRGWDHTSSTPRAGCERRSLED